MAANNFNEDGRLGQGGFRVKYVMGVLIGNQEEKIVFKKIRKDSSQGEREYWPKRLESCENLLVS